MIRPSITSCFKCGCVFLPKSLRNVKEGCQCDCNDHGHMTNTTGKDWRKEWDDSVCPCQWITTTTRHSKKDCAHYTFAAEKEFITSILSSLADEVEEIIVDTKGLSKFPPGSVDLHTTIGGNAGTRRAAQIIRSYMQK